MKARIRISVLGVAFVILCRFVAAQDKPNHDDVRGLLARFATVDDMDENSRNARAKLISMGPAAMPRLILLFRESHDDRFRTSVVSVMFSINYEEAARFVEAELESPSSEWRGKLWLFGTLLKMRDVEPARAVRLAKRVLDLDERLSQMCALGVLKEHGGSADLVFLQEYLARRRAKTAGVAGVDGVAYTAQEAIDAIRAREGSASAAASVVVRQAGQAPSESTVGASERADALSQPSIVKTASPSLEARQSGYEVNRTNSWWAWVLGAGMAALIVYLFRTRNG